MSLGLGLLAKSGAIFGTFTFVTALLAVFLFLTRMEGVGFWAYPEVLGDVCPSGLFIPLSLGGPLTYYSLVGFG